MERRTAFFALLAVLGEGLKPSAQGFTQGTTSSSGVLQQWTPSPDLVIDLGNSYTRFVFRHGTDELSMTPDELFAALKGEK